MANNYTLSSSVLYVPKEKAEEAQDILDVIFERIGEEEDDGYVGVEFEIFTRDQSPTSEVWFHHDESFNPENCARIVEALVEGLEIDEPFYCTYAHICDKPRVDEFGGGAFCVERGRPTLWLDVEHEIRELRDRCKPEGIDGENHDPV